MLLFKDKGFVFRERSDQCTTFTSVYKRILTGPMEKTSGNPCIGKPGLHLRTGNNQPISLAPYAI